MSENKLDRTNLKRHAQRVESYSVLLSKRRAVYKSDSDSIHMVMKSRIERSQKLEHFNIDIKEYEVNVQINQANNKHHQSFFSIVGKRRFNQI